MNAQKFTADDAACPMNYPSFVFRELQARGYKAEELLHGTTLTEELFQDPNFRIEYSTLRRFILNAIEATGDEHLGPRLALHFETHYIGLPAYAAMNAPRFVDGLDVLGRFMPLTFPAIDFVFPKADGGPRSHEAEICMRLKFPFEDIAYFVTGSALVVLNSLIKDMLRVPLIASRCEAIIAEPDGWAAVSGELSRVPVCFEASKNRIIFPAELLDSPLPGADPINHRRLVELCQHFLVKNGSANTPVCEVVSFLESENNLGASLSNAAAALGYSERNLRRQLERSGASYRKLVEQLQESRAREMLANTSRPIHIIAHELGYETPSNFARSFKRWTGKTPKAFRDERKSPPKHGQK